MLVLARKKNESIVIGDGIEITILKVKGNTVRIGVNAPSDVKILRGELSPFPIGNRHGDLADSPEPGELPLSNIVIAQAS